MVELLIQNRQPMVLSTSCALPGSGHLQMCPLDFSGISSFWNVLSELSLVWLVEAVHSRNVFK